MSAEDRLRAVALALPGVEERETWGKPTFWVAGRLILTLAPDGSSATIKASLDDQAALVATDPRTFTAAAYLGRYGWVTVRLDRGSPNELEHLAVDARSTEPASPQVVALPVKPVQPARNIYTAMRSGSAHAPHIAAVAEALSTVAKLRPLPSDVLEGPPRQ